MTNTYGGNGNRWWVLYNTNQTNLDAWANPGTPSGYQVEPSGNATDDTIFAKATLGHGKVNNTPTVSVENISWIVEEGPFTSKAAATAAMQKLGPAPGFAQQAPGISGVIDIGSAIRTGVDAIGNWKMWASFGWIILGLALTIIGVTLLIKGELSRSFLPKFAGGV